MVTGIVLALVVLVVAVALLAISLYNRFVRLRNRADNAWAQVDVQLRRRYDLIPNLIETVKGYASHEREVFQRVTEARSMGVQARTVAEQSQAENMLTAALRQLFAVAEAYPELRANENFLQLQGQLQDTENQIAVARQIYNDTVLLYNNAVQTFPGVLLAGPLGFAARDYLEIEEVSRQTPQVDFRDMPGREPTPGERGASMPPATGGTGPESEGPGPAGTAPPT